MGLNTKCKFHDNEHPDDLCPRHQVLKTGPTRVVIDVHGTALGPGEAKLNYGIIPNIVFLRDDGWSLGAPAHLEHVARNMWPAQWIAVAHAPFEDFLPFDYILPIALSRKFDEIRSLRMKIEARKKAIQAQLTLADNELRELQEQCKHPNKKSQPEYDCTNHSCDECGLHWSTRR